MKSIVSIRSNKRERLKCDLNHNYAKFIKIRNGSGLVISLAFTYG